MALYPKDMRIQKPRVMAVFIESVSADVIYQKILFKYRRVLYRYPQFRRSEIRLHACLTIKGSRP